MPDLIRMITTSDHAATWDSSRERFMDYEQSLRRIGMEYEQGVRGIFCTTYLRRHLLAPWHCRNMEQSMRIRFCTEMRWSLYDQKSRQSDDWGESRRCTCRNTPSAFRHILCTEDTAERGHCQPWWSCPEIWRISIGNDAEIKTTIYSVQNHANG